MIMLMFALIVHSGAYHVNTQGGRDFLLLMASCPLESNGSSALPVCQSIKGLDTLPTTCTYCLLWAGVPGTERTFVTSNEVLIAL